MNKKRFLTLGFYKAYPKITESYSSAGSPYWAFKAFSLFLSSNDTNFWKMKTSNTLPKEYTYKVSVPRIIFNHNGKGQVILLNGGVYSTEHGSKYNKFVYSNIFLPVFMPGLSCDNELQFRESRQDRWSSLDKILVSSVDDQNSSLCLQWLPFNLSNIEIKSRLTPFSDGYKSIHKIYSNRPFYYRFGGFACPLRSGKTNISRDALKIVIGNREVESSLEIVRGLATSGLIKNVYNIGKQRAIVGCFEGFSDKKTGEIEFKVFGRN